MSALKHGSDGEICHLSLDNSGYAVRDVVKKVCRANGRVFDECTEIVGERLGHDAAYVIDSTKPKPNWDGIRRFRSKLESKKLLSGSTETSI